MRRAVGVVVEDPGLDLEISSVQACVEGLDACPDFSVPPGSLEIAFVDREGSARLHADFFGDPEATDVMTFPGSPADGHAGDIAICPAVAAEQALESGLDFPAELTLYLVHAWLHLAGLRDDNAAQTALMRRGETLLMEHLRSRDALLAGNWNGPSVR